MDVTAVYELPVPVWVTSATLGERYPSGYGALRFDVAMPLDRPPVGAPPVIEGVEIPDQLVGEMVVWTQEYGAFIPDSLLPATALHRVVITAVEAPTEPDRSWRGPDQQLGECVDDWFDQVRTWVEVLTGQDLDPRHRVYDAQMLGAGLTFIEPPDQGSLGLTATTPSVRPVRPQELGRILVAVQAGEEPPLEEVLSRDARAAHRRGSFRRAVVDAAVAVEVVLARAVREKADQLPQNQRARLDRRPTLGAYIDIAEASGFEFSSSFEDLRRLNMRRVEAVHQGVAPGGWETGSLVQLAIDFLSAHGPMPRTDELEPDGSEWILPDNQDATGSGAT